MKKIAFLDRDGVINKKAEEHCYITGVPDFIFNEGIFELLHRLTALGFEFIVLTNQRGVARKLMSEEDLSEIHEHMSETFRKNNLELLDIFVCPHEENSCECRKPKPGLMVRAQENHPIDMGNSILISDSQKDIEMGMNAGLKYSIFIPSDRVDVAIKIIDNVFI
jgi:D,D-heptose 1,7-bisphosphate phosphatase